MYVRVYFGSFRIVPKWGDRTYVASDPVGCLVLLYLFSTSWSCWNVESPPPPPSRARVMLIVFSYVSFRFVPCCAALFFRSGSVQVAFSEVTAEDLPPTARDDLSVKLIRVSQLTIEYLLHVQASVVLRVRFFVARRPPPPPKVL